jgi:phage shock protein A
MRFIARVYNLTRGVLTQWIRRREGQNPAAVYESAIRERSNRYRTLREAAAGVLYVRSKLASQLEAHSSELSRLRRQLEVAVDRDDDGAALALIVRRDAVAAEVDRLSQELSELDAEAEAAKSNLINFQSDIERLRDEKARMLARLANAKLRLQLRETLNGLSPEADIQALESVREQVNRLVNEAQVSRDLGDGELEQRLSRIREAEAAASARAQLDELKKARKRTLLPVVLEARREEGARCEA